MGQWLTIYKKEMLQSWRNKQLVWVPLVMMVIGSIDLVTYYYLPEVIEMSGGLPEGAIFEVPEILGHEAMMMGIQQISLIGSLVIIAISMGTIANERSNGLAELILTKPIHPFNYITAKWFSQVTITIFSLFLAIFINWYYTNILFEKVSFHSFLITFLFFSIWFLFIVSLTILFNSFLNKSSYVFASTAIVLFLMGLVNTGFGHRLTYFPNQLTNHIEVAIVMGETTKELYITSGIISTLILSLLISAIFIFKYKKL